MSTTRMSDATFLATLEAAAALAARGLRVSNRRLGDAMGISRGAAATRVCYLRDAGRGACHASRARATDPVPVRTAAELTRGYFLEWMRVTGRSRKAVAPDPAVVYKRPARRRDAMASIRPRNSAPGGHDA